MPTCELCHGTDFHLYEGLYYCAECNIQTQELREEDEENDFQENLIRSLAIHTTTAQPKDSKTATDNGEIWLTSEAFNIIIHKQVDTLIQIGVSPKFKDVMLKLWTSYLKKCEVAFMGYEENKWTPKLGVSPYKRDLEILGGKRKRSKYLQLTAKHVRRSSVIGGLRLPLGISSSFKHKKTKKKKTSFPSNYFSIENDQCEDKSCDNGIETLEQNDISPTKKTCSTLYSSLAKRIYDKNRKQKWYTPITLSECLADSMNLLKTLCFCYLGLLIVQDQIMLFDLIRWIKEGYFPYLDASHHLPSEMKLFGKEWRTLSPFTPPTLEKVTLETSKLALFLGLTKLPSRPLLPVVTRFILDLNLPNEIIPITNNIIQNASVSNQWVEIKHRKSLPHYETQAMAFLLIAMKMIIGLDDKTELELSAYGHKIKSEYPEIELFLWDEWKEHTEIKINFLKSRNILFSDWCETLDVKNLCSYYHSTASKWHSKEVILDKRDNRVSQQYCFRKALKKTFNDVLNDSCELQHCHMSSYPLQAATQYYIKQVQYSQQYISDTSLGNLLKNFCSFTLLYITHPDKFRENVDEISIVADGSYSIHNKSKHLFGVECTKQKVHVSNGDENNIKDELHLPVHVEYWFIHKPITDFQNFINKLPFSFQWLLKLCSNIIGVSSVDIYTVIMTLEKRIFKNEINNL